MADHESPQNRVSPLACLELVPDRGIMGGRWKWRCHYPDETWRESPSTPTAVKWAFESVGKSRPTGYDHVWCKWCKYKHVDRAVILTNQLSCHKPELNSTDICDQCHIATTRRNRHKDLHCPVTGKNEELIGRSWDPSLLQYRYEDPVSFFCLLKPPHEIAQINAVLLQEVARVLSVEELSNPDNSLSENEELAKKAPRAKVNHARQFAIDSSNLKSLTHQLLTQEALHAARQRGDQRKIASLETELRQATNGSPSRKQCERCLLLLASYLPQAQQLGQGVGAIQHKMDLLQAHIDSLPGGSAASLSKVLPSLTSRQQTIYRRSNPFF